MTLSDLLAAFSEGRYETARRIGFALLECPAENRADLVLALHDALVQLADFARARDLLAAEGDALKDRSFDVALRLARDFRMLADHQHFRASEEARLGFTVDEYLEKCRGLAGEKLEQATMLARSPADHAAILEYQRGKPSPFSHPDKMPDPPAPEGRSAVHGRIIFPDGVPVRNATVTLGLKTAVEHPDTSRYVSHAMSSYPRIGPLRKQTTSTDADGRFTFPQVPSGSHDFLAITLDPQKWEIPTRFLSRDIVVEAGVAADLGTLEVSEWSSAPPRSFPSPHPPAFHDQGVTWTKCREWKLRNPFFYEFPRQMLTLPVEANWGNVRIRIESDQDEPFQFTRDGACLLTDLPPREDKVIAIYRTEAGVFAPPAPARLLRRQVDGEGHWEIDTGVAAFRLAGPESGTGAAPLQAVRGPDGVWVGAGRFCLPDGIAIRQRLTEVLEDGPLLCRIRSLVVFSNGLEYALTFTALAGEPLLLVTETSDALDGAAFEFSLREFSGGRGYLHWKPETGHRSWDTLRAEDDLVGQLPESVPWWIPPQGFGYGVSFDGLARQDYIGVFTRRRGEWIDRAFEKIAQGPIDEQGRENHEVEWPYPEMVGSSISMINVHTSRDGDVYFRFGLFSGERQWGILASSFAENDGPWKQLGRVQHAYSSPRLQEFKDWTFDVPDPLPRPHLVAKRNQLPALRQKTHEEPFASLWRKICREVDIPGPRDGLLFAIDSDPLIAWEKRILLNYVADNRATMTLLGRDWTDMYSPVGGRLITRWAEEYDLIAASGVFSAEEERRIRDFFVLMGHMYMEEDFMNWRFNARNANFEADRVDIVGAVGLAFQGHPDSKKFLSHVTELTRRSLLAYCTPASGKWYENPACYYLHASRCRINVVFHLAQKGLVDLESIPRLKDFLRWGILLLTPPHPVSYGVMRDGGEAEFEADLKVRKIPPIGDHAGIGKWLSEHYAYLGKLFLDSDPAFGRELMEAYFCANADGARLLGLGSWEGNTPESLPNGKMTACTAGNLPLLFCNLTSSDLPSTPQVSPPSRRLEGFGAVFRNEVNSPAESYLLVKQGPGGYRYHRTEGSFLLFRDGKPLVLDGGEAGETWRHSTLSFHDVHLPLSPGRVERHFDAAGFQFMQGAHPVILEPGQPVFLNDSCRHELVEECHRRFRLDPPAVTRAFAWVDGDYLIIHDDLTPSRPELSHWHLQVVGSSPQRISANDYLFPGRFGLDLRVVLPGQNFAEEICETLPITHYSGDPETWFTMQHLQLTKRHASHYLAGVMPVHRTDMSRFKMTSLFRNEAIVGAEICKDQRQDLLWFCRPGLSWRRDELHFEGAFGALLRDPSRRRLVLMGAGKLQAESVAIISNGPLAVLEVRGGMASIHAFGAGEIIVCIDGTTESFTVAAHQPLISCLKSKVAFC